MSLPPPGQVRGAISLFSRREEPRDRQEVLGSQLGQAKVRLQKAACGPSMLSPRQTWHRAGRGRLLGR
eukprot:511774-Pleurochrysis_carterae.AAC.1